MTDKKPRPKRSACLALAALGVAGAILSGCGKGEGDAATPARATTTTTNWSQLQEDCEHRVAVYVDGFQQEVLRGTTNYLTLLPSDKGEKAMALQLAKQYGHQMALYTYDRSGRYAADRDALFLKVVDEIEYGCRQLYHATWENP